MNDRVKSLREALGLSQEAFGDKIGVTRASISNIEKGSRNMSDQTVKSICREFNVNYAWLTEGLGDMFSDLPETLLDEVADEYNLDTLDKELVKRYMQLPEEKRAVIKDFLQSVFINK
ncbi:XRE family transcriptional regulator [Candidatus Saccharibacteria bacterium]|nr:XRE family transcriptional regulator [Candidatus Saccharibacteria bacterium]